MKNFLILFALCFEAQARLANPDELGSWTESLSIDYDVKKDGTSTIIEEIRIKIENESGRASQSVQNILFRPLSEKLELVEAYTQIKNKKINVDKQNTSIESGGNNKPGFDDQNKLIVAFPQVEIGSTLVMKIRFSEFNVAEKDFFSIYVILSDAYLKKLHIHLTSERPLFTRLRDPHKVLHLKTSVNDGRYELELSNRTPIQNAVIGEANSYLIDESFPSLTVSSKEKWDSFAPQTESALQKIENEALPKVFEPIIKAAQKKSAVDQVNIATAQLAERIRYFGDWRRVRGDYLPRSLNEIATSSYGDCKDIALITEKILRSLGFEAHMVWVLRSQDVAPLESQYQLPAFQLFNHAVVRAKKDNQVFWVDATNVMSLAPYTPIDIAGRPAYVLSEHPHLEMIPEILESNYSSTNEAHIFSKPHRAAEIKGRYEASGLAAAVNWTDVISHSTAEDDFNFIESFQSSAVLKDYQISAVKNKSRIIQKYSRSYTAKYDEFFHDSTAGRATEMTLQRPFSSLFSLNTKDRYSDFVLGAPTEYKNKIIFPNQKVLGDQPMSCAINSKWFSYSQHMETQPQDLSFSTEWQIHQRVITSDEMVTKDFSRVQGELRECLSRRGLVFKN